MDEKTQQALGMLTYGIYILTSHSGNEKHGMIASWVSQVSHNPTLVMVAVRENRRMHSVVMEAGSFAIHALEKNEERLIAKFKETTPAERFADVECVTGVTGAPIIENSLAYLDCRLWKTIPAGDHTLFIGEVVSAGTSEKGAALTSWDYGKIYTGKS